MAPKALPATYRCPVCAQRITAPVADDLAATMTEAADEIERLRAKVALLSERASGEV